MPPSGTVCSHGFSETLPDSCGLLPTSVVWHRLSAAAQAAQHAAHSRVRKPQPASPKAWGSVHPEQRGDTSFEMEIDISNVL